MHDGNMHRTTINLDEAVYHGVLPLASSRGKSLARTIEDLLRRSLNPKPAQATEIPLHSGNGPVAGIDIADRDRLYDLMSAP
jgi:hypothetical protein